MNQFDLFALGNQYRAAGKLDLAAEMFNQAGKMPSMFTFGPAFLNLHETLMRKGDLTGAREALVNFMNSPLLPSTFEILPKVKQELESLDKQLNPPQLPQAPK